MRSRQPKKEIVPVKFRDKAIGVERRRNFAKEILHKETNFPKPLEYADIDKAFETFIDKELDMVDNDGKRIPTYTLYSTQRFSEYSQTWEHTDENGNLLMNFKTVSRENNPNFGQNQGGLFNIPGNRRYTMLEKIVLDDNGTEHMEVYSMGQPYAVDLKYKVNFVTNTFSTINTFNMKLNKLFRAKQCYIRPNGHYIPMVIESIDDTTSYGLEERKFFVQQVTIKAMAYIINEEDFEVHKFAMRPRLFMEGERRRKKVTVDLDEYEKKENKAVELNILFKAPETKVEFEIDMDIDIVSFETSNARDVRVFVNDMPYYIDKGFQLKNGDSVRVKIKRDNEMADASVKFIGIDPNYVFDGTVVSESVQDSPTKTEEIFIE